jgi:hypothetical protein
MLLVVGTVALAITVIAIVEMVAVESQCIILVVVVWECSK